MLPYDATVIGTSGALDESSDVLAESVGGVALASATSGAASLGASLALASPASAAASLGASLALESSVSEMITAAP
jgi:hypothetical protein